MTVGIKTGDRVRLTFTWEGAEHVVTGIAKDGSAGLTVGGYIIQFAIEDCRNCTVEVLSPEWHDALVVQAGGKTFAKTDFAYWERLPKRIGEDNRTSDEVAALGPVRVVVGADGEVVA